MPACLSDRWVDEEVHDGDEDDQGNRVQVVDQVVRHTVELHCSRHGSEVVHHLVVCQPVERQPCEDLASIETTSDLIDPGIVDALKEFGRTVSKTTRLDPLPEVLSLEVFDRLERIRRPAAFAR